MITHRRLVLGLLLVSALSIGACVTTKDLDADGFATGATTTSILGMDISHTSPDGTPSLSPAVSTAAKAAEAFLPGWASALLTGVLGAAPWLASKRPRRKLIAGMKALVTGKISEATDSMLSAVGLEHSERDPKKVAMAIRAKGIAEGWLDPVSGLPFEFVAKIAPNSPVEPSLAGTVRAGTA